MALSQSEHAIRKRKEQALCETRELQLHLLQGKLLSKTEVVKVWSECFNRLKTSLLAIPDRTAAALAGKSEAEVRRILRRELETAMEAISKRPI